MLINVVICLLFFLKITAPLVQPLLTDCVDKPPVRAAFLFMENTEWKPVYGFEGYYEVNRIAQVRTVERYVVRISKLGKPNTIKIPTKIKVSRRTKFGYVQVALVKDNVTYNTYLHRIVAEAFLEKPIGCNVVNHKNGVKHDNRIENLEWTTSSGNNIHALDLKLRKPANSISQEFKKSVLQLRASGMTNKKIAERLNSRESIISGITSGRSHARV